jgi:hypothetical protein
VDWEIFRTDVPIVEEKPAPLFQAVSPEKRKRRAEAVKAVLVSQFKVDDGPLATNGLGATNAMDSNDMPQGRSQNRRVELVKQ